MPLHYTSFWVFSLRKAISNHGGLGGTLSAAFQWQWEHRLPISHHCENICSSRSHDQCILCRNVLKYTKTWELTNDSRISQFPCKYDLAKLWPQRMLSLENKITCHPSPEGKSHCFRDNQYKSTAGERGLPWPSWRSIQVLLALTSSFLHSSLHQFTPFALL